MLLLLSAYIKF